MASPAEQVLGSASPSILAVTALNGGVFVPSHPRTALVTHPEIGVCYASKIAAQLLDSHLGGLRILALVTCAMESA
jgi:hypothetical protein